MYISKHFQAQEFLPPEVSVKNFYNVIDNRILETAESIREFFDKPVRINNWAYGGKLKYRGFRPHGCNVGAVLSQHRFGRAIDFDVDGEDARHVRSEIMKHEELFKHITRMEDDVSWVHVDLKFTGFDDIELFKP